MKMSPKKLMDFYAQSKHTHPELTDPHLRTIFANELIVLRRSMRQIDEPMKSEWIAGIRMGLETAFRRVQDVEKSSIQKVYWQNYK